MDPMQNITTAVSWAAPWIASPQADLQMAVRTGRDYFGWPDGARVEAAMNHETFAALRARLHELDSALAGDATEQDATRFMLSRRRADDGIPPPRVVIDKTVARGEVLVRHVDGGADIRLRVF